ncbi:hypothetical protein GOP47_0029107 [Adiantum capillus-veneris]|nr:hypothetical protein GOP47_0029107 [Adiantum capillus-veneris]
MLASISASAPFLKGSALLGFKMAYFHASSIWCEKRADKFRCASNGYNLKDYFKYLKRKRRAAEKLECLRWVSCEIYVEQLYRCRGVNMRKFQKRWGPARYSSYKDYSDFDVQYGSKNQKRAAQYAGQRDRSQFTWQDSYTEWWGDFFHEDFEFEPGSSYTTGRSTGRTSTCRCSCDDNPGKKKAKVGPQTIGSPSDRQTLGLSPSGSLTIEELKKAFRASALKWHPDRHADAAKVRAEAKFKDCGAAYKSLLNAVAKAG